MSMVSVCLPSCCLLAIPTILLGFLTLGMEIFSAWLLQQSAAIAPYLDEVSSRSPPFLTFNKDGSSSSMWIALPFHVGVAPSRPRSWFWHGVVFTWLSAPVAASCAYCASSPSLIKRIFPTQEWNGSALLHSVDSLLSEPPVKCAKQILRILKRQK